VYCHRVGEARFEVTLTKQLADDRASIQAKAAHANANAIVFVGGLSFDLDGEESPVADERFFRGDRTEIELPKAQRDLLEFLKTPERPVIFIICVGSAIAFNNTGVSAVLDAFYPGEVG
jgi:beta-glucosidase